MSSPSYTTPRKTSHSPLSSVRLQNINPHVGALSVLSVVLCLSAALLVCLPWLATVRRCGGALALFVWGTLYVVAIVFVFTGGNVTAWEQVTRKREGHGGVFSFGLGSARRLSNPPESSSPLRPLRWRSSSSCL